MRSFCACSPFFSPFLEPSPHPSFVSYISSIDCEGKVHQLIGEFGSGKKEFIRTHEKNTLQCTIVLTSRADGGKKGELWKSEPLSPFPVVDSHPNLLLAVNPLVIHKAEGPLTAAMALRLRGWLCATSPSGYVTDAIWDTWVEDFIAKCRTPHTKDKSIILYLDGYSVHKNLSCLKKLADANIQVVFLPAHLSEQGPTARHRRQCSTQEQHRAKRSEKKRAKMLSDLGLFRVGEKKLISNTLGHTSNLRLTAPKRLVSFSGCASTRCQSLGAPQTQPRCSWPSSLRV